MSQNLISVPETDEEEQGDRQQITRDAEEEPKRVSFSALTSSLHPPRHHRGSSSQSDASSSSTNRRLHRLGHLLKQNTSKCDSDLSPDSPPDSQHSRSSRPANPRSLSASVAARLGRFSSGHEADLPSASDAAPRVYRRYRVGDPVLVSNHQSRFANLVNRYGYPPGGGLTPEEQRGPYVYVLATVQKVHFEEDAEYYTVIRVDTGVEQRADDEWMEPLRTAGGEAAARRAATHHADGHEDEGNRDQSLETRHSSGGSLVCIVLSPFMCLYTCCIQHVWTRICVYGTRAKLFAIRQGRLFLNGVSPYSCSMRVTMVNVLVLCSTWYMFIDQARLAFFPPSADYSLAIVNFIVFLVLVVELVCEVFIRPEGYHILINSEKAYAPSTARFINAFHLCGETISLVLFAPEFVCLFSKYECGDRLPFSYFNAAFTGILGPQRINAFKAFLYIAVIRLRVFGLVRHWRNMWVNNTFVTMKSTSLVRLFCPERNPTSQRKRESMKELMQKEKDMAITNVSNIGTALMVTNSHRALIILWAIMGLFPLLDTLKENGGTNVVTTNMVALLQANNLDANTVGDPDMCEFFSSTVRAWLSGITAGTASSLTSDDPELYLMFLWIEPEERCGLGASLIYPDGLVTLSACEDFILNLDLNGMSQDEKERLLQRCAVWGNATKDITYDELASRADIRPGAIQRQSLFTVANLTLQDGVTQVETTYAVRALFNQSTTVHAAAYSSFLLQLSLLICVLLFLSVERRDSNVLVLGPLGRMLKIVARYAKNPLTTASADDEGDNDSDEDSDADPSSPEDELGNFETNQLINAVAKIADLLRKCWGVAGAGIISTNLATQEGALTEVFNPTVPGKSVYALFGFAAIKGFDHALHNLGGDVMILINDVAAVLHGEVFRWGFGDSGQCNKNLGGAFLMVYRIGLVKEVIRKLEQATDVVFAGSTQKEGILREKEGVRRRKKAAKPPAMTSSRRQSTVVSTKAMSLNLQSLPGISAFTDRAVIGMLKSYAGIYRDNKLLAWKNDFRLGAGVGAFSVSMIFGMDAGWAVEGAVGSKYKIDATYLSPHVNMASRMMSACKQYDVSILLSQAVQELMSSTARQKLRHIDTVTVKGSSLQQRIYTYDARHKGVDFFLFCRSEDQADLDADRYTSNIWNTDQDLKAMRQHVTEDFMDEFNVGRDEYILGRWPTAIKHLQRANEIMLENVMDQGYIEDELDELQNRIMDGEERAAEELRNETGDGPSICLINFMKKEGGRAPAGWAGYRPLLQK